ncbi:MAG: MoxR-like ATPase [Actinomycetota bacterium]|nr:ATPase associated with various cellular, 3 [Cryptosporangiaceae bacterium]MDQ1676534.1 MoxR-like ATPase [Actinomycetota bacterium]
MTMSPPGRTADPAELTHRAAALVANVERVVRGRRAAVELVVAAVLAGGHALLEDVPGSGKTTLARAVARSVGGRFQRIQATSDLLPADLTGSGVWNPHQQTFEFVPGPLFANVVLADELNRTTPRTQSALLEAMEEGAVTVDGHRHPLPDPFFLVATQNPVEQHGTYPLPEGQLDRFTVRVRLGDLDPAAERLVVREQLARATVDDLGPVLSPGELRALRAGVREVFVADAVLDHAVTLVRATRGDARVLLGASSRAAIALVRCAQARAVLGGREYVAPDDVRALAVPVLAHRLVLAPGAGTAHRAEELVAELVARVPVPVVT